MPAEVAEMPPTTVLSIGCGSLRLMDTERWLLRAAVARHDDPDPLGRTIKKAVQGGGRRKRRQRGRAGGEHSDHYLLPPRGGHDWKPVRPKNHPLGSAGMHVSGHPVRRQTCAPGLIQCDHAVLISGFS